MYLCGPQGRMEKQQRDVSASTALKQSQCLFGFKNCSYAVYFIVVSSNKQRVFHKGMEAKVNSAHKERVVNCRAFLPRNSACLCVCVCVLVYIHVFVFVCTMHTHGWHACRSQMIMPDVFFNCFSLLVVETGSLTEPRVHFFDLLAAS